MSERYGSERDLLAGISMPPEVLDTLRRRLTAIERSTDTLSVHLASERAQGIVEALEVLKVLKPVDLENLFLAVGEVAQSRAAALNGEDSQAVGIY